MGPDRGVSAVARLLVLLAVIAVTGACPYPCTCTQLKVNCYGKELTEIPNNFPPDVISIDLQYNKIKTIGDQFHNLMSLMKVMLRFNRISHLADGTFAHLPNLRHINLGSNKIANLSSGAFHNVSQMSILDLTDNLLTSVDDTLDGLSSLTKLVLTRNRLKELAEGSLRPLTNLVYFMADENRIAHVHPAAFRSLTKLSFVSMIKNPLGSMDDVLSSNTLLSYLNLDDCGLTSVPSGLPWATRNLQLRRNNISTIYRDTFAATRYLGIVMLDDNGISRVEKDAFTPIAHLQELWLSGNRLSEIPTPIPSTVHRLHIDNNEITSVTSVDFPLDSHLKVLSLKGNKIDRIDPFTFSRLASLQKLYISGNAIAQVQEKSFFGMRNLTLLDVSSNPVAHIDVRFAAGLHKLDMLDMSYINDSEPFVQGDFFRDVPFLKTLLLRCSPSLARNILTSNVTLQSFYNLKVLDVRDNTLRSLDTDMPRFFPSLKHVKLSGNAWVCDPRLLWLYDWMLHSYADLFVDVDSLVCAAPWHLAGSYIANLPYHAFFYTTTLPTTSIVEDEDADIGSGEVDDLMTGSNVTDQGSSERDNGDQQTTSAGYTEQGFDSDDEPDTTPGKRGDQTSTGKTKHTGATTASVSTSTSTPAPDGINDSAEKSPHLKGHSTAARPTASTTTTPSNEETTMTKENEATTSRKHTSSPQTTTTIPAPSTPTPHPRSSPAFTPPTTTPTTPKPTDIPRYGGSKIKTDGRSSSFTRNIIIATCVAGAVLVIVVVALVLILRHKRKIYWVLNRAVSPRTQQSGDTELVLSDQDDPDSRSDYSSSLTRIGELGQGSSTPSVETASDDGLCTRLV